MGTLEAEMGLLGGVEMSGNHSLAIFSVFGSHTGTGIFSDWLLLQYIYTRHSEQCALSGPHS